MTNTFDVTQTLAKLGRWLPYQGPIKEFVCLNPLMAYQHLNFHDGMRRAGQVYGAYSLLDIKSYRDAWSDGRISDAAVERALAWHVAEPEARDRARQDLFEYPEVPWKRPAPYSEYGIRSRWRNDHGIPVKKHADAIVMRLVSAFLDQGVSLWRMPNAELGFYEAVKRLVKESLIAYKPLSDEVCQKLLAYDAETAIHESLKMLVSNPNSYEHYILDFLFGLPGWSAMVRQVELKPQALLAKRQISIKDYVAIALVIDVGILHRELKDDFKPLKHLPEDDKPLPMDAPASMTRMDWIRTVWHEALEWSLYEQALKAVAAPIKAPVPMAYVQAGFCIDDRMCSIRRHVETCDPEVETFGTAGFFGMDFFYQYADDKQPAQNCPIVLTPKHLVHGTPTDPKAHRQNLALIDRGSHKIFGGWLITQVLGFSAAVKLAISMFRPTLDHAAMSAVSRVADKSILKILRTDPNPDKNGLFHGYSVPELADRVAGQLNSTGIVKNLAPLIVLVAHGSSTVNNPHFAAYDCGACMGKPGTPNSRAFAMAANMPEVRAELARRNIVIPESTVFVGALYDTTRDELLVFDTENLKPDQIAALARFQRSMDAALAQNALERCRRFELVPLDISPDEALRTVKLRSASLFEARPELTHTANALAIVGRRALTRGYFMDRRAFLNSYDPFQDPEGDILAGLLGAVIPVCGGISLTYFFARMDNEAYGAGTKLPHNVVGLIGVSNGVEGDLLTGLPHQMVEVHEPLRLMTIIDHEPEIALAAARRNPNVYEWVKNEWVRYAAVSPTTGKSWVYKNGEMVPVDLSKVAEIPHAESFDAPYRNARDNRPFKKIVNDGVPRKA